MEIQRSAAGPTGIPPKGWYILILKKIRIVFKIIVNVFMYFHLFKRNDCLYTKHLVIGSITYGILVNYV